MSVAAAASTSLAVMLLSRSTIRENARAAVGEALLPAFESILDIAPGIEPLFGTLAPARIVNPDYGTRCSTVLLRRADGRMRFSERTFLPDGSEGETVRFEFPF